MGRSKVAGIENEVSTAKITSRTNDNIAAVKQELRLLFWCWQIFWIGGPSEIGAAKRLCRQGKQRACWQRIVFNTIIKQR
jgi:hypothetical protein